MSDHDSEIVALLREIRANQKAAMEIQRRAVRFQRWGAAVGLIVLAGYVVWVLVVVKAI